MPANGEYKVFISHGSADKFIAGSIRDRLANEGVATFLDENDIAVGSDFRDAILENIRGCNELAVLLTPTSIDRAWVFAEVGIAADRELPVVGIAYGVPMPELHSRGAISLIGNTAIVQLDDVDKYVAAVVQRARSNGHG